MKCNNPNCNCYIFHEDVLNKVNDNLLSDDHLLNLANYFKVLSDFTRVKILEAIKDEHLDDGACENFKEIFSKGLGDSDVDVKVSSLKAATQFLNSLQSENIIMKFTALCDKMIAASVVLQRKRIAGRKQTNQPDGQQDQNQNQKRGVQFSLLINIQFYQKRFERIAVARISADFLKIPVAVHIIEPAAQEYIFLAVQAIQRHTFHRKLLAKILCLTQAVAHGNGAGSTILRQRPDFTGTMQLVRSAGFIVRVGNGILPKGHVPYVVIIVREVHAIVGGT